MNSADVPLCVSRADNHSLVIFSASMHGVFILGISTDESSELSSRRLRFTSDKHASGSGVSSSTPVSGGCIKHSTQNSKYVRESVHLSAGCMNVNQNCHLILSQTYLKKVLKLHSIYCSIFRSKCKQMSVQCPYIRTTIHNCTVQLLHENSTHYIMTTTITSCTVHSV